MKKAISYRYICSVILLLTVAIFLFVLRYSTPLLGDDIGGLVKNNPDSYLDDYVSSEECTLDLDFSFTTTFGNAITSYQLWWGRMSKYLLVPLVKFIFTFPDGVNWVLFSIYITAMAMIMFLLIIKTIWSSAEEALDSPMKLLLLGLLVFYIPSYSYAYMTRILMYTFTNIYVFSLILYLWLYCLIRKNLVRKTNPTVISLIGINIVGLLAGFSHEVNGVLFGIILLIQLIRYFLEQKDKKEKFQYQKFFLYIGFVIGYCGCFFAPGNFNRAGQSHESTLQSISLWNRIGNSVYIHAFIAYKLFIIPIVIIPLCLIAFVVLLKYKQLTIREIMRSVMSNIEWFLAFAASAIIWGVCPRVVNYGMLATNAILIIGAMKVLNELQGKISALSGEKSRNLCTALAMFILIALIGSHYLEVSEVWGIAGEWRTAVLEARAAGLEEVIVPAYPEDLDYRFFDIQNINNQGAFDKTIYKVVYGTHILIEKQ